MSFVTLRHLSKTTYSKASTTADGLMSKKDKKKVDGITEATDTEIDNIINGLFEYGGDE